MKKQSNCTICNRVVRKIHHEKYYLNKCTQCKTDQFIFENSYDYGNDKKYTSQNYLNDYELRWAHKLILSNNFLSNKKSLEIGCFNGFFVKILMDKGINAFGIDINKKAIDWGRKKLQIDTISTNFDNEFDSLILIDVLEHIENPKYFLKEKILKHNLNSIIISCPNSKRIFKDKSDWPPHHYWRFSSKSFAEILKPLGFIQKHIYYETSILLLIRNFIGRLIYGYNKKWFTGANVFSVGKKNRLLYNYIDKIISYPFKLVGLKYASILVVYEKE